MFFAVRNRVNKAPVDSISVVKGALGVLTALWVGDWLVSLHACSCTDTMQAEQELGLLDKLTLQVVAKGAVPLPCLAFADDLVLLI